ncbi:MAG: D-xylose transport system permease protein [Frankiaceae bacterium]|jgi:D-xylose transport system permease protein|nr:D-xylose transport system permease protein [Frankiaceae bacterium]
MSESQSSSAAGGGRPTDTGRPAGDFSLDVERRTVPGALRSYVVRLRSGEPGALPSVLGLVVLAAIFSQVSSRFLSENNIGNLPGQGAYIAIIAMGLVFVLLLGEIDLSAGTTGGICAGFAAQAVFSQGLHHGVSGLLYWSLIIAMVAAAVLGLYLKSISGPIVVAIGVVIALTGQDKHVLLALVFAVALGCAVGIFVGWLVAAVGIPSFIVTLALFLAFQGVLLFALKSQPIGVNNYNLWYGLAHDNMSPAWSWVFTIVVVTGYFAFTALKALRAQAAGLAADTMQLVVARAAVLAAIAVVITYFANQNRNTNTFRTIQGLPYAATIPIALMIVATLALTKTPWGRHLYATGGNQEAARRAGIDVRHIKVSAFTVNSAFAALGGVFLASNTGGAQLDLGAGNILLFAVAAAVIGGTSLFGGRGKPRDAILGALVIVMIPNGIGLKPNLGVQHQEVITGLVLLVAASVDAISRRRALSGR